jgi:hypothetical protein
MTALAYRSSARIGPHPPTCALQQVGGFLGCTRRKSIVAVTAACWTAGADMEWLFAPNWTVKAEYLHYDLGSVT